MNEQPSPHDSLPANILVIDDDPINFDVIETKLDPENYQLSYAASGDEGFELLKSIQPDVILLDMMMPGMTGIEFCHKFKQSPAFAHIPVIMVTALTTKEDLAKCLEAGADDFVSKPVDTLELRSRVRSMLRIKQQYDALQKTLQLREDLTRMIVHDLRTPLSVIVFAAEMLKLPNISLDRQHQKIDQILTAGQQLQSMIDTLLLMAKLESGKLLLQRTPVDLRAICDSVLKDIEPIASQKQVKLISNLPPVGGIIEVDINLLHRVLDNLLSNAIKFSPRGSEIQIIAEYLNSGKARIQVTDQGPGIPPELHDSIFQKYEVGNLMKNVSQIGLGLAFCKLAIEAHGGIIEVANQQPQGAIFVLEF